MFSDTILFHCIAPKIKVIIIDPSILIFNSSADWIFCLRQLC